MNKCNGNQRKLCILQECKKCFQKSFASSKKASYWSKNNNIQPRDVFKNSNKKYEFLCNTCNHFFDSTLSNVSSGWWCPYCAIGGKKLCSDENCDHCFKKSFASHPKSKYWSCENNKSPRSILKGTKIKYSFDCPKCKHKFETSPLHISSNKWCPYCSGNKLCSEKNCIKCFKKSFASHPKSEYWSDKNIKSPRESFLSSNCKYIFNCICGHEFSSSLNGISRRERWCPYCCEPSNSLCEDTNCKSCFDKSFASSDKANTWSPNNKETSRNTFLGSNKKFLFICDLCNEEFEMQPNSILSGQWCICQMNRTENKLKKWLDQNFDSICHQAKFSWCKNKNTGRFLPFDFNVNDYILIEADGEQHFTQVSNWSDPKDIEKRDRYKEKCAIENGYSIIRILTRDIYKDKKYETGETWKEVLTRTINKVDINRPSIFHIYNGVEEDLIYI